jgi:lipopolysaccharide export system ATP-binding protein
VKPRTIDALLASLGATDLSALVAVRVLLTRVPGGAWLPVRELVHGIDEEYERWYAAPGVGGRARGAEAPRYLDEYVLPRLERAGIVERQVEPGAAAEGAAETIAVRIAPALHERIGEHACWVAERIDRRIGEIVGAPQAAEREEAEESEEALMPAAVGADLFTDVSVGVGTYSVSSETAPASRASVEPPERAPRAPSTLRAEGLVKVYRKRRVVDGVALHVNEGEIVGLLGPNGAGKTTTFYMIVGLIAPDAGKVYLGNDDLTSVPMYKRARRGIGYLAQEPSIFRKLTVEENVLAILQMRGIPKREQEARLETLLDELGIKHLRHSKAYALSGGERRRLEITRALVGEPRFMLLDEPFAGVDPIAVHDIQQIVSDLRRRGIGVLISDHNVEQTLDIVDRAYIMYDGRVRVAGTVSELVWNDEVAEIYLGPTLTARMRQRYRHPE